MNPKRIRRIARAEEICEVSPAEFVLQRLDENAGCAHGAGGDQHGEEGRGDDDPAVMDIAPGKGGGEGCGNHGQDSV
ncbi:hypothetical protein ACOJBM_29810 [Rhizobium beringeri]